MLKAVAVRLSVSIYLKNSKPEKNEKQYSIVNQNRLSGNTYILVNDTNPSIRIPLETKSFLLSVKDQIEVPNQKSNKY